MLGGNIKNYTMKKIKGIFFDGVTESVELLMGTQVIGIAIIEGKKVNLYEKNIFGEGKRIDIPEYKKAILEYFNSKDFEEVRKYS